MKIRFWCSCLLSWIIMGSRRAVFCLLALLAVQASAGEFELKPKTASRRKKRTSILYIRPIIQLTWLGFSTNFQFTIILDCFSAFWLPPRSWITFCLSPLRLRFSFLISLNLQSVIESGELVEDSKFVMPDRHRGSDAGDRSGALNPRKCIAHSFLSMLFCCLSRLKSN